jgi:hypothetical protein
LSCRAPAAPGPRRHRQPGHHRTVCAALSHATRQALAAEPARGTANGTVTSYHVARAPPGHPARGGRRPAVPQRHLGARPGRRGTQAIGMACIVFAGNVGDGRAPAQVAAILSQEQQDP